MNLGNYKWDWVSPDGSIVLACADCLDVLPTLEAGSVDAVVTDPPYGIGWKAKGPSTKESASPASVVLPVLVVVITSMVLPSIKLRATTRRLIRVPLSLDNIR